MPSRRPALREFLQLETRDVPAVIVVDTGLDATAEASKTTLREAILQANANPGPDVIRFGSSFPGLTPFFGGQFTIVPDAPLPDVTDAVTIRGNGSLDTMAVEITGGSAGAGADGLVFRDHSGSAVRELSITGFGGAGIRVGGGGGHQIANSHIGTKDGRTAKPNGTGIVVEGAATGVAIGGSYFDEGAGFDLNFPNVISGNTGDGVALLGGTGHVVRGNHIGLRARGNATDEFEPVLGNGGAGLRVGPGSGGNTIGGDTEKPTGTSSGGTTGTGFGNIIAGNAVGIVLDGPNNTIQGTQVGGRPPSWSFRGAFDSGRYQYETSTRGNRGAGVRVAAPGNKFLGEGVALNATNIDSSNHIGFNGGPGIEILSPEFAPTILGTGNRFDFNGGPAIVGGLASPVTLTKFEQRPVGIDTGFFISGVATGSPGQRLRIDLYAVLRVDPSGEGEGSQSYGGTDVTIGPDGRAAFEIESGSFAYVSAIATDLDTGRSSRFSRAILADPNTVGVFGPPLNGAPSVAGAGAGGGPVVSLLNVNGPARRDVTVFEESFSGGVRVAAADFNGDGVLDVVVGTGPGRATRVRVLDGKTLGELFALDPFEASFLGGVYVAAGDVNGDGVPDLVITPDEGGGPRVRVFTGRGFGQVADFFGIDDKNFFGGARAAVGDMDGDGTGDLVVAAGFGGGPRVAVFDGRRLGSTGGPKLFGDVLVFEDTLRNGVFIAVGDIDGDGRADLVAGGGPGGGPRVKILNGRALTEGREATVTDLFAGDEASRGGVRVATRDVNGDGRDDLLAGSGSGDPGDALLFYGSSLAAGAQKADATFNPFGALAGGVYVA